VRALSSAGLEHIRRRDRQTILLRRLDHRKAESVNAPSKTHASKTAGLEKRFDKPGADVNRQISTGMSASQLY
jgi:hypothetical protein